MKAIEIWDVSDHRFRTLTEILSPLPSRIVTSAWEVSDFFHPDGAEAVLLGRGGHDQRDRLANTGTRVAGAELVEMARRSSQVIWGTFLGYDPVESDEPWIALHAIDSTFWRVETRDIATRQALMRTFTDVRLKQ